MTWQEFRQWAWEEYRYRIKGGRSKRDACVRPVLGASGQIDGQPAPPVTGTGSGNYFQYGVTHQRRFSMWLIARNLIDKRELEQWLSAAELHDDGWLVNDGTGIRWEADPDPVELVKRGFVAIKCGI